MGKSKTSQTPIFDALCAAITDPYSEIHRLNRARAFKANGPTPASSVMDRVIQRERFGMMHSTNRHDNNL